MSPREGGGLNQGCWIAVYSRALLTLVLESRSQENQQLVEDTLLFIILSQAAKRWGCCGVLTAIWVIGTDGVQLVTKLGEKGGKSESN